MVTFSGREVYFLKEKMSDYKTFLFLSCFAKRKSIVSLISRKKPLQIIPIKKRIPNLTNIIAKSIFNLV